jgi:multidrug resistance protein, MATE family
MSFKQNAKSIFTLGWPMLIGQLAGVGQGATDAIMAGHYSRNDLAAVGLGVSYFITLYVALMGLQALASIIGGDYGAGKRNELGASFRQGLWAAFIVGSLGALLAANPDLWIAAAKPSAEVEAKTRLFCLYIAFEMPLLLMLRTAQIFSQAVSEPKAPMVASLAMLVLNIILNWVFIYGKFGLPEMGGPGCGVASSISAGITLICYLLYMHRAPRFIPFDLFKQFSWPELKFQKQLFALGVPIGITIFVEVSSFTVMQVFVAQLGAMVASAHTAVGNFSAVVYMLPLTIANASAILISQAIGASDSARANDIARSSIKLAAIVASVLMFSVLAFRPFIAASYTNDVEVQAVIVHLLVAIAAYQIFDCLQGVAQGVLRGYKITLLPTIVFVCMLWGVGLCGGYVLAFKGLSLLNLKPLGAAGFWWGSVAGLSLVAAILAPYALMVSKRYAARHVAPSGL